MALPSTIYRASIQLSDLDRQVYEQLQTTVAKHPSETEERLLARLLAYALCYDEELNFTKGIGSGDEPDLWAKSPDGRVRLWVEVGLPDPEKLAKSCRHVEHAVLFAFGSGLARWLPLQLPKLSRIQNLTVVEIDYAFLRSLVAELQRSINWSLTVTEGALYLTVGDKSLEAPLKHLCGPRLT
jgi:uncharacterized protein YaeQ